MRKMMNSKINLVNNGMMKPPGKKDMMNPTLAKVKVKVNDTKEKVKVSEKVSKEKEKEKTNPLTLQILC